MASFQNGPFIVTGASGQLGRQVIDQLIEAGAGPIIDICGRATFLIEEPSIRTRLMTIYIMLMFIGGGIGSWAGTAAYEFAGWTGSCVFVLILSLGVTAASAYARRVAKVGH